MTHRGPFEGAWRDLPSRVLLILMMTPWALIALAGAVELVRECWRWI